MDLAALITHTLLGAVVVLLVLVVVVGARGQWARLRRQLGEHPTARMRFYRAGITRWWALAAVVPAVALVSPDLSWADLGWAWPDRYGTGALWTGVGLALYLMLIVLIAATRLRRALRRGRRYPGRVGVDLILPRTAAERRVVVLFAVTAGITEEAIFRGLLIGAGTHLYQLPVAVAVAVSLVLFSAGHGYQGRAGVVGSALFGIAFTAIYLLTGSLLLVIVMHIWQDLVALLLVPPAGSEPERGDAGPTGAEPTGAEPTGAEPTEAEPAAAQPTAAEHTEVQPAEAEPLAIRSPYPT